ncbi:MAG TPA: hypothetical protein VK179_11035 [Bacteroidales bacterium]|nr:hypothetical protein [Bacteroidales bacterium]
MKPFYLILCLLIFFSCEEDKKEFIKTDFSIFAGQKGDSVSFFDFIPNIRIDYTQTACKYFYGDNSVDLDFDNNSDLKITYDVEVPDLDFSCCNAGNIGDCFPTGYQLIELTRLNKNYQIATDSDHIIKQFVKGEKIFQYNNWDTCTIVYFANSSFPAWINNWENNSNKYIGIRLLDKDTIYGWIKAAYIDTLIIEDFAFKKK